jgi:hypothetical protein
VPILTQLLTGNFLLLLLYLGWTTDYRHTPTKNSFSAGWRASRSSLVFSGVFIAEEVDKSTRQGVRWYHHGWFLFEHAPNIFLFHQWSFFLIKSKTSGLGTTLFQCQNIEICRWLDVKLTKTSLLLLLFVCVCVCVYYFTSKANS